MKLALVALLALSGFMQVTCNGSGPLEEIMSGVNGLDGGSTNSPRSGENSVVVPTKSQDKTVPAAGAGLLESGLLKGLAPKEGGYLGAKGPAEMLKLLLNPIEFCKRVAKFYKLHFGKFLQILNKGATFGLELALQPALLTMKIIEKIFVPDACKLRLICRYARPLSFTKDHLPKFSSRFLEGSHIIKAVNDGLHGHDCEVTYSGCSKGGAPKLKKEYEAAGNHQQHQQQQNQQQHSGGHQGNHEHSGGNHEQGNHEQQQQQQHGGGHEAGGEQYESSNVVKALKSVG